MKPPALPSSQQGYAVLFFLFFIGAVALGTYSLYDSGWVASERIRIQNTADNTTFSAVNMIARDMNMMAITNRGMIANQVMVGQIVALASWGNYIEQFAININKVVQFANLLPPPWGQIIARVGAAIETGARAMSTAIDRAAPAMIRIQTKKINPAISWLQQAYHGATYVMAVDVFADVLKKNDPDAELESVAQIANGAQFLNLMGSEFKSFKDYKPGSNNSDAQALENERVAQFAQLINDSRDGFTADRSMTTGKLEVGIGLKQSFSFDLRAGTDFVPIDKQGKRHWNWTSLDAASYNQGFGFELLGHEFWVYQEVPMGWGAAHALNEAITTKGYAYRSNRNHRLDIYEDSDWKKVDYTDHQRSKYWRDAFRGGDQSTSASASLAALNDGFNNLTKVWGLQSFYDFASNDQRNATESITLIFSKKAENFRLQENLANDFSGGYVSEELDIDEQGGVPGERIFALSSARVDFERPEDQPLASSNTPWSINWGRHDGLYEYGNLYNPFWEARLIKTDEALMSAAIQVLVNSGGQN